jgi:hypothetical protein
MMRKMTMRIATQPVAYRPSTKNIAAPETIVPSKAVSQLKKWKEGLKFGAELILRRKQAKFITKKVI